MYKNIIKNYAEKLDITEVKEYAKKEGVSITDYEAETLLNTVKDNIDDILEGNAEYYMESLKYKVSTPVYEKMLELFNKYKKFID